MPANDPRQPQSPPNRAPCPSTLRLWRFVARRRRGLLLAFAAMPLFQTTGCIPDLLGGLSFELQLLINNAVINAASVIIQNLLHL